MNKYKVIIIWRADDVTIGTATGIKHDKKSSVYEVVSHQFHTNNWFSVTYENGQNEYFNRDVIFSVKPEHNAPTPAA